MSKTRKKQKAALAVRLRDIADLVRECRDDALYAGLPGIAGLIDSVVSAVDDVLYSPPLVKVT